MWIARLAEYSFVVNIVQKKIITWTVTHILNDINKHVRIFGVLTCYKHIFNECNPTHMSCVDVTNKTLGCTLENGYTIHLPHRVSRTMRPSQDVISRQHKKHHEHKKNRPSHYATFTQCTVYTTHIHLAFSVFQIKESYR